MRKHIFFIIASILIYTNGMSQISKQYDYVDAIKGILSKKKWLPHQYFKLSTDPEGILAYNAIPQLSLLNSDSLKTDATNLANNMIKSLGKTIPDKPFCISVSYFDRGRYMIGFTKIYIFCLVNRKITNTFKREINNDEMQIPWMKHIQIQNLQDFNLAPNQFLVHFLQSNINDEKTDPRPRYGVTGLINIVDDWKGDLKTASKKQFEKLKEFIMPLPHGSCTTVTVRYLQRIGGHEVKDFNFPLK